MYTKVIRFGTPETNSMFLYLYRREFHSLIWDEGPPSMESIIDALEEKEFIKDLKRIGGARFFRISDKGFEFASDIF
jgi:DNA-binding PadR family transcriptional regulator